MKTVEVYTVDTIGGQITGSEAHRETVPAWLAPMVAEQIKNNGFIRESIQEIKRTSYDHFSANTDDRRAAALYLANIYIGEL